MVSACTSVVILNCFEHASVYQLHESVPKVFLGCPIENRFCDVEYYIGAQPYLSVNQLYLSDIKYEQVRSNGFYIMISLQVFSSGNEIGISFFSGIYTGILVPFIRDCPRPFVYLFGECLRFLNDIVITN